MFTMSKTRTLGQASGMPSDSLARLDAQIVECRACPRLVEWREDIARTKRAAFNVFKRG